MSSKQSFDYKKKSRYNILYIVTNKKVEKILKQKSLNTIFFKKNLIFRIQNFYINLNFSKLFLINLEFKITLKNL